MAAVQQQQQPPTPSAAAAAAAAPPPPPAPAPSAPGRQQSSCPIPYPERFHEAVKHVGRLQDKALSDEARLLFYALAQQANVGPCRDAKPWGWNVVESAKWQSWSQLGAMSSVEAMRLYVKTLDEERPEWWAHAPDDGGDGDGDGGRGGGGDGGGGGVSISSAFNAGTWVVITQDEPKRPLPRYEQGAALVGTQLYVLGGHYSGRYLSDAWTYDLTRLQWAAASLAAAPPGEASPSAGAAGADGTEPLLPALRPCAGQTVTPWQGALLVLGGHVKGTDTARSKTDRPMPVRLLDPCNMTLSELPATGEAPCARGGHSACLVGDALYVFGGEDSRRRPLSDLHVLDLPTLAWTRVAFAGRPRDLPPARSAHAAAVYQGRYLLLFGGSIGACLSDVWVLDLESRAWSRPAVHGDAPGPRAGHAGALVGSTYYVVGGGNNVKGCTDMVAADLSELPAGSLTWRRVCSVPVGSPLSSEGISMLHAEELGLLVAFGGYNGKYHNAVSVFKLPQADGGGGRADNGAPTAAAVPEQQQQQPMPQQQQQQQQQQHSAALKQSSSTPDMEAAPAAALAAARTASMPPTSNGGGALRSEHEQGLLRELAVNREQLKRELAHVRGELADALDAADQAVREGERLRRLLAESEAGHEAARRALSAEQAKTLKLEANVAELRERLAAVAELEHELERYRRAERESAAAAAKRAGGGGGLWGYIAGAPPPPPGAASSPRVQ